MQKCMHVNNQGTADIQDSSLWNSLTWTGKSCYGQRSRRRNLRPWQCMKHWIPPRWWLSPGGAAPKPSPDLSRQQYTCVWQMPPPAPHFPFIRPTHWIQILSIVCSFALVTLLRCPIWRNSAPKSMCEPHAILRMMYNSFISGAVIWVVCFLKLVHHFRRFMT